MILVIVYVGAVAVLFLFVVMMLDVDFVELKAGFRFEYGPSARLSASSCGRDGSGFGSWVCTGFPERAASPTPLRLNQYRSARPNAVHRLRAAVPDGGPRPAGCHDRRHRPDAAVTRGRQAPEHCQAAGRAQPRRCLSN
jgi:hypothetical protein